MKTKICLKEHLNKQWQKTSIWPKRHVKSKHQLNFYKTVLKTKNEEKEKSWKMQDQNVLIIGKSIFKNSSQGLEWIGTSISNQN